MILRPQRLLAAKIRRGLSVYAEAVQTRPGMMAKK